MYISKRKRERNSMKSMMKVVAMLMVATGLGLFCNILRDTQQHLNESKTKTVSSSTSTYITAPSNIPANKHIVEKSGGILMMVGVIILLWGLSPKKDELSKLLV